MTGERRDALAEELVECVVVNGTGSKARGHVLIHLDEWLRSVLSDPATVEAALEDIEFLEASVPDEPTLEDIVRRVLGTAIERIGCQP